MDELNSKKDASSFWVYFGKFSAVILVISAIAGIIQFTFSLNKKEAKIIYSLKYIDYHKSPERLRPPSNYSFIRNEINITDFVLDKNEYESNFKYFLELEISNIGKQIAEDLTVNFPFDGVYYLVYHNKEVKKGEFKRQVQIGSLKINEICTIYIWTGAFSIAYPFQEINYAHNSGSGIIHYPLHVYNPVIKFLLEATSFTVFIFFVYTLIIFIITAIFISLTIQKNENIRLQINKESDSTNEEEVNMNKEQSEKDDSE